MRTRPRHALAAFVPVLTVLAISAPPAVSATTPSEKGVTLQKAGGCRTSSDDGNKRRVTGALTRKYDVKQIDQDENFSGAPKELTFVLQRSGTVSNSVAEYGEVSGSMKLGAFGSLEAKAGVNLGETTTSYAFSSVTEKLTLKSGDVYFRARGVRTYTLTTKWQACRRRPSTMVWVTYAKARAVGHLRVKAVVGCKQKTPAGSFSRVIKAYCP